MHYIFDQETKTVRETHDTKEWAQYFEIANRRVGYDEVNDYIISTVFLGLDHGFGQGEPLLFETMIFDKKQPVKGMNGSYESVYMMRYTNYDEAFATHQHMVERLRGYFGGVEILSSTMPALTVDDFLPF